MASQAVQPGARPAGTGRRPAARGQRIVLRAYPKVIFLYPTLLAAIVATVGTHWWPAHPTVWGLIFLVVASLNLVVISFDFPRATSLSLFFVLVIVVLGALLLNRWVDVLPRLEHLTRQLAPHANTQFYGWLAAILFCLILVAILIHRHLDYWELMPNELVHHHGLLGDVARVPAPGMEVEKDITDVFEFLLLRSGRLILQPRTPGRAIVLENVPNINKREREIQALLAYTDVRVQSPRDDS